MAVPVGTAAVRVGAVGEAGTGMGSRPRPGHDWGPKGAAPIPRSAGVSRGVRWQKCLPPRSWETLEASCLEVLRNQRPQGSLQVHPSPPPTLLSS